METKEIVLYNLQHLKQLVFEVTDSCNLNCNYCGLSKLYDGHDERLGKKLSFEKARLVLDYIFSIRDYSKDVNYPINISFYGGEPLLNMKLVKKIITYIRQSKFQEVILGMTTNAVLLDKHMDYLAENKFQLVISLDGNHNNHSYRVDHSNRNSFPRVFKNIKLLQEKHPKYFQDYVQFNSVLHNRNSVEEIYDFINHNFGKLPLISALNTVGIRKEKTEEFRKMYQNVNESILNSSNCNSIEADMFINTPRVLNLTKYIFIHSGNVFNDFNDLIFDISGRYPKQTGTCSPFAKKMFVTVSGKILQCERIPHYFSIGKVLKDRVELNAEDIANKQNQYSSKIISQCDRCYLNKECPQCIYNIEDICNENPECSCFCDEKKSKKNREMTIMYLREHPEYYEKIMNDVIIK